MKYYTIPARKGSKGFPNKNRLLFDHTFNTIPKEFYENVIITTDDDFIIEKVRDLNVKIIKRSAKLSGDKVPIKPVLVDVIEKCNLKNEDDIILLYLTYPRRSFEIIEIVYSFYKKHNAKSLLCARELKIHPYLCFYRLDNYKGKSIVDHELYRRQDYPECFALSHFVCIIKVGNIEHLNNNLYSEDTIFFDISPVIDIDTLEDYKGFL